MEKTKESIVKSISEYMIEEEFPLECVKAIQTCVCFMNWSRESENEIIAFAKHLQDTYGNYNGE